MSGALVVAEKSHAELGASGAYRWMACPGSVQLSRQVPEPPETEYSIEGTRAHALAQLSLEKGVEPDFFVGISIEGAEITEEMAEYVKVFTDYCRSLIGDRTQHWIEKRFNLAKLQPPGPMFGTADFVLYNAETRTLHVVDLKYGQGVVVEALGNEQLRYYALGAALELDLRQYPVDSVRMTIVQPRVAHPSGMVRSDEIPLEELIGFTSELMAAARRTLEPDAPRIPGEHCRFCPASGVCPEQREQALAVAQTEFDVIVAPAPVLPAPAAIPTEQLVEILSKLHILEEWAAAVRGRAQGMLERGEEVPGFKLVAKRANRKWTDEEHVQQLLEAKGLTDDEMFKRALKSPAQIEKILKKKPFAELLGGYVHKESSGYNMVPDTDPRPAVRVTAGEEFPLIPAAAGGGSTGSTRDE